MKVFKKKLEYLKLDVLELLGLIEMRFERFIHKRHYDSLTENDIPKDTFYCYDGCRCLGVVCPFLDHSRICGMNYCHYIQDFDVLLDDQCKMCGLNEPFDEEYEDEVFD